jgi:hypothetical protein
MNLKPCSSIPVRSVFFRVCAENSSTDDFPGFKSSRGCFGHKHGGENPNPGANTPNPSEILNGASGCGGGLMTHNSSRLQYDFTFSQTVEPYVELS